MTVMMGENPPLPPELITELHQVTEVRKFSEGWDLLWDLFSDT